MESARQDSLSTGINTHTNYPFVKHRSNHRVRQPVSSEYPNVFNQLNNHNHHARPSSQSPSNSRTPSNSRQTIAHRPQTVTPVKDPVQQEQSERAQKYQEKLQKQQLAQLIYAGDDRDCLDPDSTRSRLQQRIRKNAPRSKQLMDRQQLPPDLSQRMIDPGFPRPSSIFQMGDMRHFTASEEQYRFLPKPLAITDSPPKSKSANNSANQNNGNNKRKSRNQRNKKQKREKRQKKKSYRDNSHKKGNKTKSDKLKKTRGNDTKRVSTQQRNVDVDSESELPQDTSTPDIDRVPLLSNVQSSVDTSLVSESNKEPLLLPRGDADIELSEMTPLDVPIDDRPPQPEIGYDSDDDDDHISKMYQRLPSTPGERKPLLSGDHFARNFATFGREEDEKVTADAPSGHSSSSPTPATPSPSTAKPSGRGLPPPPPNATLRAMREKAAQAEKAIVSQTGSDERVNVVLKKELSDLIKTNQGLDSMFPGLSPLDMDKSNASLDSSSSKSPGKTSTKKNRTKKYKSRIEKQLEAEAKAVVERRRAKKRKKKQLAKIRRRERDAEAKMAAETKARFDAEVERVQALMDESSGDDEQGSESGSESDAPEESDHEEVEESVVEENDGDGDDDIEEPTPEETEHEETEEEQDVEETKSQQIEISETKTKRTRRRRRKKNTSSKTAGSQSSHSKKQPSKQSEQRKSEPVSPSTNVEPTFTVVKSKARRKKRGQKATTKNSKRTKDLEKYSIVRSQPTESRPPPPPPSRSPRKPIPIPTPTPSQPQPQPPPKQPIIHRSSTPHQAPPAPTVTPLPPKVATDTAVAHRVSNPPSPASVADEIPPKETASVGLQTQPLPTENVTIQAPPFLHTPITGMSLAPFTWPQPGFIDARLNVNQEVNSERSTPSEKVRGPTKPPVTGLRNFFQSKHMSVGTSTEASVDDGLSEWETGNRSGARTPQDTNSVATTDGDEHSTSVSTHSGPVNAQAGNTTVPLQYVDQLHSNVPAGNGINPSEQMYSLPHPTMFQPLYYPFPPPNMYVSPTQSNILSKQDTIAALRAVTGNLAHHPPLMMPIAPFHPQMAPRHVHQQQPTHAPPPAKEKVVVEDDGAKDDEIEACKVEKPVQSNSSDKPTTPQSNVEEEQIASPKNELPPGAPAAGLTGGNDLHDEIVSEPDSSEILHGTLDLSLISDASKSLAGSEPEEMPDLSNHSHEGSEPALDDMKSTEDSEVTQSDADESQEVFVAFQVDRKFPRHIFNLNSDVVFESKIDLERLLKFAES